MNKIFKIENLKISYYTHLNNHKLLNQSNFKFKRNQSLLQKIYYY